MPRSPFSPSDLMRHCKQMLVRRGIDRRIYLAQVSARIRARSMIAGDDKRVRAGKSGPEVH
jgi:hypothetical protein